MLNRFKLFAVIISFFVLLSSCSREDGAVVDGTTPLNEPDNFAAFLNPIAGLASGAYTVTAITDTAGEVGDFVLTVTFDNGTQQVFKGSWTATVSEVAFNFLMQQAGGLTIILESEVENNLKLVNENGYQISAVGALAAGNTVLTLLSSGVDSAAYGKAYYAAIDPTNAKDTLEKFKVENGFYEALADGRVIEPRFRDVKDLGYGRGMRAWTSTDGSLYFFAENFQVRSIPGQEYTSLNLDALLLDDRTHHFGTNAIEFSTYPYGVGEPSDNGSTHKFVKFFTFDATKGNQQAEDHQSEVRLDTVDLDGHGFKSMPGACAYCHGGTLRPLREDGTFRDNTLDGTAGNGINGDVNAKLQLMEVASFEFADYEPFRREDQELLIKSINLRIYCSYPNLPVTAIAVACAQFCVDPINTTDCDGNGNDLLTVFNTATGSGEWSGDFAREMLEGWYDDPGKAGFFDRDTFNDNYVPDAWKPDLATGSPPAGSDQLFLEVVQPSCFVCHSRLGTNLGSSLAAVNPDIGADGEKDIDFSTYEKFISHAAQIKQYVYDRGIMPLSLRGYDAFWDAANDAPEILATHLNSVLPADNQVIFNSENKVDQPGVPVADAGPDRTSTSPVRMFGSNSRFVDTYKWKILSQPDGSDALLSDDTTARALLTTSVDGDYVVQLDASFGTLHSIDTVLIKIDATMNPDPKNLNFETHIKPVFTAPLDGTVSSGKTCAECHQASGGTGAIDGVPVHWLDTQPATGDTASNALYKEVLSRVDFKNPENSLLLLKPSGDHHYGGQREGFEVSNPANRQNYDTVLNWILEGAVEKAP